MRWHRTALVVVALLVDQRLEQPALHGLRRARRRTRHACCSSSEYVPSSPMAPSCSTAMECAPSTVLSRCAMISTVLCCCAVSACATAHLAHHDPLQRLPDQML